MEASLLHLYTVLLQLQGLHMIRIQPGDLFQQPFGL